MLLACRIPDYRRAGCPSSETGKDACFPLRFRVASNALSIRRDVVASIVSPS
jgi:hypothetical protein